MTRISSYDIYQCPDCKQQHILPNYASISVVSATDAFVSDGDMRICFGCGAVKPFRQFMYVETKQKQRAAYAPYYLKFIKRLLGLRQAEEQPHPTRVYPFLNQKLPTNQL